MNQDSLSKNTSKTFLKGAMIMTVSMVVVKLLGMFYKIFLYRMYAGYDEIAGFCTFANKDELPEEYDFSPFIGFMFVDEKYRGHRLSGKLIDAACGIAKEQGFSTVYIMSGEVGLYEKYGFEKLGDYATIYGTTDQLFQRKL